MQLKPRVNWSLCGSKTGDLEPALLQLLKAIQQQGSLQKAARALNLSYRYAWGLVKKWEKEFASPLVHFKRGRGAGTHLTELGEKLVWADEHVEEQLRPGLSQLEETLNAYLADYFQQGQGRKLKIYASHGLAIRQFFSLLERESSLDIETQTMGSLDSLQNLHNGYCQVAGFHMPLDRIQPQVQPLFQRWISEERQLLLRVSTREQGLMVKQGNPKKIQSLQDLCKRSIRFINRQANSGTRIIIDELLKAENIKATQINGYKNEEFTHAAVAAMIASGTVDAGFGIRAVAEQFQLGFVPFLREVYLLAIDRKLDESTQKKIISVLKSAAFRKPVSQLAGYDASQSGKAFKLK